jgi:uncharacterized protein (DUF952 family)/uncharacterized protein YciI
VRPTFHLVPAEVWARRDPSEPYVAPSLAAEGFIHCTDGVEAIVATANRHYRDDPRPFVVVTVDLDTAGSPWRYDDAERIYPHVHGPIAPAALGRAVPILRAADGTFLPFGASEIPAGISVEQVFVVEARYGPNAERLRPEVRPEHLDRIARLMGEGRVVEAGGYLDLSTALLLVRADTADEAVDLFRDDVYVRAGVWLPNITARPFGRVVAEPDPREAG